MPTLSPERPDARLEHASAEFDENGNFRLSLSDAESTLHLEPSSDEMFTEDDGSTMELSTEVDELMIAQQSDIVPAHEANPRELWDDANEADFPARVGQRDRDRAHK